PVFEGAVACEEIGRLVPESLVEVVAEHGLQMLDRILVLEPGDALAQRGDACGIGRGLRDERRRRKSEAQERCAGQRQQDLACAHHRAPSTGLPVTGWGAWNGGTLTSGNGR